MNPAVDTYISGLKHAWWQTIVRELRAAVHAADPNIEETIKWGTPSFEHQGRVAWVFCAADWVHFSFPQGALLDASHGLFEDTDNKAQRTIKVRRGEAVPRKVIIGLVKEAVQNNLTGKRVDLKIPKAGSRNFDVPRDYERFLGENGLLEAYQARPYYQQHGWIQWIEQAKQPATTEKRKQKMLEELQEGTYMPPKSKP